MSASFKTKPIVLRHLILFEVLQGNSIDQAYVSICSVIGKEVVDHKIFVRLFIQFSKEKFNNKKNEKSITKVLSNDKNALRACILYEFLKYQNAKLITPIFGVFVNFCKGFGLEDVLNYQEFEFWFYRFSSGEYDLNYERDKDKKIYELMDMPVDVMENIVEYLDIFDRIKLAKTSRSLRTFVENQKLFHHTLQLLVSYSTATISFGKSVAIEYVRNEDDCEKRYKNRETLVRGVAFSKQAVRDIEQILKNPKLHLDTFSIIFADLYTTNAFNDLKDAFKFTHYLNVKNVILFEYLWGRLLYIIPFLKPGYLTTIDITSEDHTPINPYVYKPELDSMYTIFETEQWKQAKYFRMKHNSFIWPLRHLYHFKEFFVGLDGWSVEDVRGMKEILFKSPDFEKCSFNVFGFIDWSIFKQEFGNAIREDPYITYHYPIPNSSEYFEIEDTEWRIEITRKKA